jgi:hypothetical protein
LIDCRLARQVASFRPCGVIDCVTERFPTFRVIRVHELAIQNIAREEGPEQGFRYTPESRSLTVLPDVRGEHTHCAEALGKV